MLLPPKNRCWKSLSRSMVIRSPVCISRIRASPAAAAGIESSLHDSHPNDVLLVEQVDRLTRLSNDDWSALKRQIRKEARIVSLDVPTSYLALDTTRVFNGDSIIEAVLEAINNMLIDLMAAMARKDYFPARIDRSKVSTSPNNRVNTGRQADSDRHKRVMYFGRKKG